MQEYGRSEHTVLNTAENSGYLFEHLPPTLYPSVLIPEGWNEDVVSHIHLLLLVVYLPVLISCIILALGIFLVDIQNISQSSQLYISECAYNVLAMAGKHCASNCCGSCNRWLATVHGTTYRLEYQSYLHTLHQASFVPGTAFVFTLGFFFLMLQVLNHL